MKLHHVGWNWDTSVNPAALAGVFVLDMTTTLDRDGNAFTGKYVTDSYDNDVHVIISQLTLAFIRFHSSRRPGATSLCGRRCFGLLS